MRKIFFLLLAILSLSLFVATPRNASAVSCSSLGGTCGSPTSSTCATGTTPASGATDCLGGVCCKPGSVGINPFNIGSIPNGSYGCSFKIPTTGTGDQSTITIAPADMLIRCQSGGICVADKNASTVTIVNGAPELLNGFCVATANQCPVCDPGYLITNQGNCVNVNNPTDNKPVVTITPCSPNQGCNPGVGCWTVTGVSTTPPPLSICKNGTSCPTALGDLPTNLSALLTRVFSIVLSIAGVVALGLIIASGYRLMISQGNPEQVKGAREQLTAAIIGLLFIIFSLVILQIIGVNILKIPGFS